MVSMADWVLECLQTQASSANSNTGYDGAAALAAAAVWRQRLCDVLDAFNARAGFTATRRTLDDDASRLRAELLLLDAAGCGGGDKLQLHKKVYAKYNFFRFYFQFLLI